MVLRLGAFPLIALKVEPDGIADDEISEMLDNPDTAVGPDKPSEPAIETRIRPQAESPELDPAMNAGQVAGLGQSSSDSASSDGEAKGQLNKTKKALMESGKKYRALEKEHKKMKTVYDHKMQVQVKNALFF